MRTTKNLTITTITEEDELDMLFARPRALHEAAFAQLLRQLDKTVEEVKAIKESSNDHTPMGQKNLVLWQAHLNDGQ